MSLRFVSSRRSRLLDSRQDVAFIFLHSILYPGIVTEVLQISDRHDKHLEGKEVGGARRCFPANGITSQTSRTINVQTLWRPKQTNKQTTPVSGAEPVRHTKCFVLKKRFREFVGVSFVFTKEIPEFAKGQLLQNVASEECTCDQSKGLLLPRHSRSI